MPPRERKCAALVNNACTILYDGHGGTMDIRIREIPEELHIAFKLTVVINKTSIQQETLRLIEEYVRREKKVPYSPKK